MAERDVFHDPEGRLTGVGDERWRYDAAGRLVAGPTVVVGYGIGPQAAWSVTPTGRTDYRNDMLGRRAEARVGAERTDYRYDLFGQLVAVERADDDGASMPAVEYAYDGFGRLVARDEGGGPTYQLVGVDGHRLVDVDATGRVVVPTSGSASSASGGSTARSAARWRHRSTASPIGRPLGWVDGAGRLHDDDGGDAFGFGATLAWDRPGVAGLFGDPATGLVHAGRGGSTRPSPSSSPPTRGSARMPPNRCRHGCAACSTRRPAAPHCRLGPVEAYAWCRYAPLDLTDPSGHNWLGLIFSTISSLLWGMQATSRRRCRCI